MTIYLKGVFKPLGRDRVQIDVQPTNPFQEQTINDILISIHPGEMTLTAVQKINIADEILIYFKDEHKKIPRNEEFESVKIPMYEAVENIVRYLKYFYGIYEIDDIDEKIIMENAFSWSPDKKSWYPIPDKRKTAWRGTGLIYVLDDNLLGWMPHLIHRKVKTFFGFTHLHKAFGERNTRHQWINATIAAELAFKEFLALYKPDTVPVMSFLPSPPLDRMYNNLLVEYSGSKSPMARYLSDGAKKRNELIHKPRQKSPGKHETNVYLHQIQVAILHLYTILYPNDPFFEYLLSYANSKLEREIKDVVKVENN